MLCSFKTKSEELLLVDKLGTYKPRFYLESLICLVTGPLPGTVVCPAGQLGRTNGFCYLQPLVHGNRLCISINKKKYAINNIVPQGQSESEDDLLALKTRSLVFMERNLVSPCDVSPIQPKQLREAENLKPGMDMEKLLLERVMLRKELKLRSMQERLLDQTQKLEEAKEKLAEYESLPGMSQFKAVIKIGRNISKRCGSVGNRFQRGALGSMNGVYQVKW